MTAQGLEVIDHSVHLTHEWINELAGRLDWSSKRSALRLMRVTLHRIRDHLLVDELAQMSAQLPVMIRGFFFEGWVPKDTPIKERHEDEFIAFVGHQMADTSEYRGRDDIKCVFDLLNARLSRGEVEDIRASLPQDIRDMWSAP
ncbi:DUF2267 domain-containing protein [uncultured Sulfitobacter sp.]|uniref:DUF2267 domain-containing protein n=1 Tax=uncultured Sulfitobacter sp. TaxID=191468 RepID=UPI002611F4FA|nr:DUF2267 domain-containing protein [uncultured Sulfitobacter sp.]